MKPSSFQNTDYFLTSYGKAAQCTSHDSQSTQRLHADFGRDMTKVSEEALTPACLARLPQGCAMSLEFYEASTDFASIHAEEDGRTLVQ
jgi:hypothetical protein